jgi:hypothetical protein
MAPVHLGLGLAGQTVSPITPSHISSAWRSPNSEAVSRCRKQGHTQRPAQKQGTDPRRKTCQTEAFGFGRSGRSVIDWSFHAAAWSNGEGEFCDEAFFCVVSAIASLFIRPRCARLSGRPTVSSLGPAPPIQLPIPRKLGTRQNRIAMKLVVRGDSLAIATPFAGPQPGPRSVAKTWIVRRLNRNSPLG